MATQHDCPVCGALVSTPATFGTIRCDNGHLFSLNETIPSSPEVTSEHWDELWTQ